MEETTTTWIEECTELTRCDLCNEVMDDEMLFSFDDQLLCEECLDNNTFVRHSCNERRSNENCSEEDETLCRDCFINNYTTCTDCGRVIQNEEALNIEDDDDPYCRNCYDLHQSQDCIHNYYYKPEPLFYGIGRYYGVELEIDQGGKSVQNVRNILAIGNNERTHIYCKHDSSLINGFEIVSHPASLEYHLYHIPWNEIMIKAIAMGYQSHNCGTSGLHIHVGRSGLGSTIEEQENVIGRILFFMETHWEYLLKFSRRTLAQVNQWAARYGCKENPKETLKCAKQSTLGRYVCLNLSNSTTIEFRIFRGTLRYATFVATLQLVDEICVNAITLTDETFQQLTWKQFCKQIPKNKQLLIDHLKLLFGIGGA